MCSLRKAWQCAGWNLYTLRKNPRFYLALVMGCLLCWMLTDRTLAISRDFHTDLQVFEAFIWCFADGDSILYASLVLMLVLSAFPRLDAAGSYVSFRAGRRAWLMGQVLTVLVITLGYCLLLLAFSMLLGAGRVHARNAWSDTATLLSFSPGGFDPAFAVTRKMVKLTLPYPALAQIFVLLFLFMLLLSSVQLALTVLKSRQTGTALALLICLTGFILTPERFMQWLNLPLEFTFYANLLSAWLSPLQHATYMMHNFGYDLLPRLSTSMLLLGGASAGLLALSALRMRHYNYVFSGGIAHD